jgi:hypothetical protein
MEDCGYASPQLFFTRVLRPKDGRLPKNRIVAYKTGPDSDDIVYTLVHWQVFFSTFEELKSPIQEGAYGGRLSDQAV